MQPVTDVLNIRRGDVFVVRSSGVIPWSIRLAELIWSSDHEAKYNHCGIVLSPAMDTLEVLWTVKHASLWRYAGKDIAVYRPMRTLQDGFCDSMPITPADKDYAIKLIEKHHKGSWYPVHRLILHLFRPLAKISTGDFLVCSELVAKYLWHVDARGRQFAGANPDMLADEWRYWRNYQLIYQGKWPEKFQMPIAPRILKKVFCQ
jgi:hypothetical protein